MPDVATGLSAPWVTYYREMVKLFGSDPEIMIAYDEENKTIHMYVENEEKSEALTQLLPCEKTFGNVTLKIKVLSGNKRQDDKISLFQQAFRGNPVVSYIHSAVDSTGTQFHYVVFKREVVQFFNDNLKDIAGNESTLFQNIAKDIFGEFVNINFCTNPTKAPV